MPLTHGRVPADTQKLLTDNAAIVRDQVITALPPDAGPRLKARATELILGVVLRDWRENSNTTGLIEQDIQDLQSFVTLAVEVAGKDLPGRGAPVFTAVLAALLEDWLANWNAEGQPGPPFRN